MAWWLYFYWKFNCRYIFIDNFYILLSGVYSKVLYKQSYYKQTTFIKNLHWYLEILIINEYWLRRKLQYPHVQWILQLIIIIIIRFYKWLIIFFYFSFKYEYGFWIETKITIICSIVNNNIFLLKTC